MPEKSPSPWSKGKSPMRKIVEGAAIIGAVVGLKVGAEKAAEAQSTIPEKDTTEQRVKNNGPQTATLEALASITAADVTTTRRVHDRIHAMPDSDDRVQLDYTPPASWSPETPAAAEAYRQLRTIADQRFHEFNVGTAKSDKGDTFFSLMHDDGEVKITILPDGSFVLGQTGGFDRAVAADADSLSDLLDKKLALSRQYKKFEEGTAEEDDVRSFIQREGIPEVS